MVRVYADDLAVYTSSLSGYELEALTVTNTVNRAGTATITMPSNHPAYNSFLSFRTIVTVHRHGELIFRGRPLPSQDDFYGRRTITCEGERCFLRDAVMRAYSYSEKAVSAIFTAAITAYNEQVEENKRFKIGSITVTDVTAEAFENEQAEQVSDTIDKLVETYGGYIIFTSDEDGARVINWLAELSAACQQVIEFGENLLDFSRSGENTDLATAVLPYGAKNSKGKYLNIKNVNGGVDYIQDDEAVAAHGFIMKPVYWDDITKAATLLTRARQYLSTSKLVVTSLKLTAVDLSLMDRSIDSFAAGDWVRVRSKPHNVDDDFQASERTYDLLDPSRDSVLLGAELLTLTGADVAGDKNGLAVLKQYTQAIPEEDESDDIIDGGTGGDDTGGDVVVDGTTSYTLGEVATGETWINGKAIYRCVIDVGAIEKGAVKTYSIPSTPETFVDIRGCILRADGLVSQLNWYGYGWDTYFTDNVIKVRAKSNTTIGGGYVIVEYTKSA